MILDCVLCCDWLLLLQQHIILLVGVMPGFALFEGSNFCIVFLCMDVPQLVHLFCLHGDLGSFQFVVLREDDTANIRRCLLVTRVHSCGHTPRNGIAGS